MPYKIGTKQTTKMVEQGLATTVYVAEDADSRITEKIVQLCTRAGVDVTWVDTMASLGKTCGIDIGAAMAAYVPDQP
ncbi:ribosomal L7Ae/L30e/S12e/Gadd45 family protein [Paenibacillus sp. IB182496]|uniref:Ribosomal L7Ae/L30e/S12e/Gadd45 family protein n=1 Tax=Paenibacillus sabuli TaxID=2772509 RepID=A0A927BS38_9BACL|nr:ribosomal L7Ae/L30e/S12e/Gadd45 family protein [Paenibacillus sabuli]MBD2844730.1 ribosomal L7Ae/L30e/S12e/Gadd45 family protein [Paenibacillus sabuli]